MKKTKLAAMLLTVLSGLTVFRWFIFPALTIQEAGAIGIIGGADGPTAIFTTTKIAPHAKAIIVVFVASLMAWLALVFKTKKK